VGAGREEQRRTVLDVERSERRAAWDAPALNREGPGLDVDRSVVRHGVGDRGRPVALALLQQATRLVHDLGSDAAAAHHVLIAPVPKTIPLEWLYKAAERSASSCSRAPATANEPAICDSPGPAILRSLDRSLREPSTLSVAIVVRRPPNSTSLPAPMHTVSA